MWSYQTCKNVFYLVFMAFLKLIGNKCCPTYSLNVDFISIYKGKICLKKC